MVEAERRPLAGQTGRRRIRVAIMIDRAILTRGLSFQTELAIHTGGDVGAVLAWALEASGTVYAFSSPCEREGAGSAGRLSSRRALIPSATERAILLPVRAISARRTFSEKIVAVLAVPARRTGHTCACAKIVVFGPAAGQKLSQRLRAASLRDTSSRRFAPFSFQTDAFSL